MNFKRFLAAAVFFCLSLGPAYAQMDKAPENWFNLDLTQDGVRGVSSEKAYQTLLKDKSPKKEIIVAILDSGVEVDHEDLADVMWTNKGEIAGNGIDDDKNGYIDDMHGWNFIGNPKGENIDYDNLEFTRQYVILKNKKKRSKKEEAQFKEMEDKLRSKKAESKNNEQTIEALVQAMQDIEAQLGKTSGITVQDIEKIDAGQDPNLMMGKMMLASVLSNLSYDQLKKELQQWGEQVKAQKDFHYNPEFDPRSLVGDNYNNPNQRDYGNNDYEGPDAEHGTHVAGIVGANRKNDLGMKGVANNVRIMTVRMVPNGDERDKDVANGIRYAVDNGAQIINMSFGKGLSHDKKAVDAAVKYAEKKGVLLVHAAGNSSLDIEENTNYPSKRYGNDVLKGKNTCKTWLEVGALSWQAGADAPAPFSNFGQNTVHLFAPGVDIYSTVPNNGYAANSGTSMASPVVAGVAALVWSYYPEFTAQEIRQILLDSAVPISDQVKQPGSEKLVPFKRLCITGGVVNAYTALELAEQRSKKK